MTANNQCLFWVFFIFSPIYTNNLCILVHGTWAKEEKWHQPRGDFFEALQQNIGSQTKVLSFSWSGNNAHTARVQAGQQLAVLIKNTPVTTTITLIAHSHGGNVCFLASQLLASTNHRIATLYTLGTPISPLYQPNMAVIGELYTLFSFGDPVQTVSNTFDRLLPLHERLYSIELMIHSNRPNHSQLHSPLVAHWLLALPLLSKKQGFPPYAVCRLQEGQWPTYTPKLELPRLVEQEKKLYTVLNTYLLPRKNQQSFA